MTSSNSSLTIPNTFDGSTLVHPIGTDELIEVTAEGHKATRGTGALELARAIRAGVPERASGELAYHVLDAMLSIDESIATGEPVVVDSTVAVPPPMPASWDPYARTV